MLPELSLSWRFIKPVRALLVFLVILLASFVAIGVMYWQTLQDYQRNAPTGAAPAHYYSIGSDEVFDLGWVDTCVVEQVTSVTGIESFVLEFDYWGLDNGKLISDYGDQAIHHDAMQTASQQFLSFFDVEPVNRFFDHQQLYAERWVYVNEQWWLENQQHVKDYNGYKALEIYQETVMEGQTYASTELLPIAGVLPANFHPYQDKPQPNFIVSLGLQYWELDQPYDRSYSFSQPQPFDMSQGYYGAQLYVKTNTATNARVLEQTINQAFIQQPAPCLADSSDLRYIKVLPGTRHHLAAYEKQGESVSLLTLVMIALGLIVMLYTLAFAKRMQWVRQQEFLLKIAMGGGPSRIAKQIMAETVLLSAVSLLLAVLIYWPLNHYANLLGFTPATQVLLWPWLALMVVVGLVGCLVVLTSRKVINPDYVYTGLNNLRHSIQHKFWAMQLNHSAYLVILAISVLIMALISSAYWRQLSPTDVLANTDYKVLVKDIRYANGETETERIFGTFGSEFKALLRSNRNELAMLCTSFWSVGMQQVGSTQPPKTIITSDASDGFFEHVLGLGPVQGRTPYLTPEAAGMLGVSPDSRDLDSIKLATVPSLSANGELVLRGRQSVQQITPSFSMPNFANVPALISPTSVPSYCFGVLWVSADFDMQKLSSLQHRYEGEIIGYRLITWREFMTLEQEVAVQRLRLVVGLSVLAMISLFAIVLLNTSFLFKRMQPWYWLNIAQGMPPRVAKMQSQLRIGVMSAISLLTALVIALFGFYEFFPLVSQWLPQRDALNIALVATVVILVVQQISLWWCARTLSNKDMSTWQG